MSRPGRSSRAQRASFEAAPALVLVVSLMLAAGRYARADDAVDRLVALVGRDAGLCVEIPGLDQTITTIQEGALLERLKHSQLYADWRAGGDFQRIQKATGVVEKFTGRPFRQFVREVFGTAVVVAVYPDAGPRMSAILITEAVSREALDAAIDAWNRAEPQQTQTISFAGQSYYKRLCAPKNGRTIALYYGKLDRTFFLSDQEDLVRRTLTLAAEPGARSDSSLLGLPAYRAARESLTGRYAARAYVNPRAWDGVLGLVPGKSGASAAPGFASAWSRARWLALSLRTDRGVVVEVVARFSTEGLTEDWKRFVDAMSGPAEFLQLVPADALVVIAGRQAFSEALRYSHARYPQKHEERAWDSFCQVSRGLLLGLDLFDDVLPALRENWGAYVVPRGDAEPGDLPVDGLIAVELPGSSSRQPARANRPGESSATARRDEPALRDAIDNGLNTGLNLVAAYANMGATDEPAIVRTEVDRETRIRWIERLGQYEPAFGLTRRFLVLATGPSAIRRFAASEAHAADTARPRSALDELRAAYFPDENQVFVVDTAAVRRLLERQRERLIQQAVRVRSMSPVDAERTLHGFLDVAGLFDSVFVAGRLADGSARLVFGGITRSLPSRDAALPAAAQSPLPPAEPKRSE